MQRGVGNSGLLQLKLIQPIFSDQAQPETLSFIPALTFPKQKDQKQQKQLAKIFWFLTLSYSIIFKNFKKPTTFVGF